jgi:hypothetical protein
MRKLFGTAVLAVIALGSLALVIPTPAANACKFCRPIQCPPCYELTVGSCNQCPTCKKIQGCTP